MISRKLGVVLKLFQSPLPVHVVQIFVSSANESILRPHLIKVTHIQYFGVAVRFCIQSICIQTSSYGLEYSVVKSALDTIFNYIPFLA